MKRYLFFFIVLLSFCFNWNRVEAKSKTSREEKGCTKLDHNRFRYYDSNSGTYISKAPIGLAGNNPNLYAFVYDSNTVDVFGLMELFRGDRSTVSPDVVFNEGFKPKGTHNDLTLHTTSNTTAGNFVSSTSDISIAEQFAGKNGYVYVIETDNGIDINKTLGANAPFPEQLEHSIKGGVKPDEVKGAYKMNKGVRSDELISNPNYKPKNTPKIECP